MKRMRGYPGPCLVLPRTRIKPYFGELGEGVLAQQPREWI